MTLPEKLRFAHCPVPASDSTLLPLTPTAVHKAGSLVLRMLRPGKCKAAQKRPLDGLHIRCNFALTCISNASQLKAISRTCCSTPAASRPSPCADLSVAVAAARPQSSPACWTAACADAAAPMPCLAPPALLLLLLEVAPGAAAWLWLSAPGRVLELLLQMPLRRVCARPGWAARASSISCSPGRGNA